MTRWPVVTAILGITIVLAMMVMAGIEKPQRPTMAPGVFTESDASIDRFSFVQTKDGDVQWKARARRARMGKQSSMAVVEDLHVTLYNHGEVEMTLEGDEGVVNTSTRDFTMNMKDGGVIPIALRSGYTIYTDRIQWNDREREIHTDAPVRIHGNGIDVTGRGMKGKLSTETFQITHDVRAVVTSAGSPNQHPPSE